MDKTKNPDINSAIDDVSDRIRKTNASTDTSQKRLNEIGIILDDMISKIIETSEQTSQHLEPAADKKSLLKELNRPFEIFKRVKNISIVQYLEGNRRDNIQTPEEESVLSHSLILSESDEDSVEDVLENIIENVEHENPQSGQSLSIRNAAAIETEMDFIGFGEEILNEQNTIEEIEQLLNNLIKEVHKNLIDSCLELSKTKPVEELELLLDKTSQENLSKTIQKPLDKIEESSQDPHRPAVLSFSSDISDCRQQPKVLKDCFQQTNVSTDSLQQNNLKDCSPGPNLLPTNQQNITSTDCLKHTSIYVESLQKSTSVSSGQQTNTMTEPLHQTTTQEDYYQNASTLANSLKQAFTPARSLAEEIMMDRYLSDIVETAHQVLNSECSGDNSNPKARRAATLVQSISDRSRQSNTHQVLDNLLEVQNMIDIIDGIGDLNEYLHMDIRKLFLLRRDLRRISSYVYEHLATISMCRSKKFIKEEAFQVTECGFRILVDIKIIKSHIFTLFKNYFLIQRSFLKQSLKLSSVPYECLIGDGRFTLLINCVKMSAIRLCGTIFSMGELEELHQVVLSHCRDIRGLVDVFTALAVVVDHKRDKKKDKKDRKFDKERK